MKAEKPKFGVGFWQGVPLGRGHKTKGLGGFFWGAKLITYSVADMGFDGAKIMGGIVGRDSAVDVDCALLCLEFVTMQAQALKGGPFYVVKGDAFG